MVKNLLFIFALILISANTVSAQLNTPYQFSSIGTLDGFENSNSSPINFQSQSNCLQVENGLPVFLAERNTGLFASACRESIAQPQLQMIMYPNPAVERTLLRTMIKPEYAGSFQVTVVNMSGIVLQTQKATAQQIFDGIMLDVSRLQKGVYTVLIESDTYKEHVNFIKAM